MLFKLPSQSTHDRRQVWLCGASIVLSLICIILALSAGGYYASNFRVPDEAFRRPGSLIAFTSAFSVLAALVVLLVILREQARNANLKPSRYLCTPITALTLQLLSALAMAMMAIMSLVLLSSGSRFSEYNRTCKGGPSSYSDDCDGQYDTVARLETAAHAFLLCSAFAQLLSAILAAMEIHRVRRSKRIASSRHKMEALNRASA